MLRLRKVFFRWILCKTYCATPRKNRPRQPQPLSPHPRGQSARDLRTLPKRSWFFWTWPSRRNHGRRKARSRGRGGVPVRGGRLVRRSAQRQHNFGLAATGIRSKGASRSIRATRETSMVCGACMLCCPRTVLLPPPCSNVWIAPASPDLPITRSPSAFYPCMRSCTCPCLRSCLSP